MKNILSKKYVYLFYDSNVYKSLLPTIFPYTFIQCYITFIFHTELKYLRGIFLHLLFDLLCKFKLNEINKLIMLILK